MSNVVKLHLPAGGVRVVRSTKKHRREHDTFIVTTEEGVELGINNAPSDVNAPVVQSSLDEFEERLKSEFKAGFDEGRRHAEKNLRDALTGALVESQKSFETLTREMKEKIERFQAMSERDVVKLALAIAEKVVKREIVLDDQLVLRQINEAVKRVVGIERIKIRINPRDEELVRAYRTNILATTDAVRELAIEADETITRGGCVIESDSGNVDALIATQSERIYAALLGEPDKE